ncbi:MAG: hypothetical protein Q7R41_14515 [Phycisphaerales bacterium]|nr:hypothetical protein [Phycisphaerales bacterium]
MHDQWRDDFEHAMESLSDSEKAGLIDSIARSMQQRSGRKVNSPERVYQRLTEIAALPLQSPADNFSARDHDALLYGSPRGLHSSA